jgi:hypothetical protein
MTTPDLARRLWCTLASVPVAFPPTGITMAGHAVAELGAQLGFEVS